MPSVVVSAAPIVPPIVPLAPSLLTNTEKPCAAPRPATVDFAVDFGDHVVELGVQRRAVAGEPADADCDASVERRSSSVRCC